MTGMRNRLIHEYFGVDHDLVWEVLQRGHLGSAPEIRGMHSPLRSALRGPGVNDAVPLLWPVLTSRAAAYTSPSASPFQA